MHLKVVDILLPSLAHKPEPADVTALCEQEDGGQQSGVKRIYTAISHGMR